MSQYKQLRETLGLSQEKFWGGVGVPQNTGSRYESSRYVVPLSVQKLIAIRYEGMDVTVGGLTANTLDIQWPEDF